MSERMNDDERLQFSHDLYDASYQGAVRGREEKERLAAADTRSGLLRAVEIVGGFPTDSMGIVEVIDQEHLLAALRAELGDEG